MSEKTGKKYKFNTKRFLRFVIAITLVLAIVIFAYNEINKYSSDNKSAGNKD